MMVQTGVQACLRACLRAWKDACAKLHEYIVDEKDMKHYEVQRYFFTLTTFLETL